MSVTSASKAGRPARLFNLRANLQFDLRTNVSDFASTCGYVKV